MSRNNILFSIFIVSGMIVLLYLMNDTFRIVRFTLSEYESPYFVLFRMSLWGFLFGILIEWKGLKNLILGSFHINWLLIPALLLTTLGFIPIIKWFSWFGVGNPFYIEALSLPEVNLAITILSGVLLIRGLTNN
ncbi:hypothetical protein CEY16_12875 [Halalkalibacillus sediminis]|uniref:Uncharacterized protein n=1 Tax=Halalkalibacillus sediminis TaxID=2018042 RepID=A0A2I0QQU9_9BACI|nr:hypothetical protein [Halalkalibacillus sediminis]PKR76706.1 hypothetical protein CEY16_12875 [Halalkalibacillus sediminis]